MAEQVQALLHLLSERFQQLHTLDLDSAQLPLRGLVERMAQLTIMTLLLEQAESELLRTDEGTEARKLLIANLYMRRHIRVHPDGWMADDDRTALECFEMLVGGNKPH